MLALSDSEVSTSRGRVREPAYGKKPAHGESPSPPQTLALHVLQVDGLVALFTSSKVEAAIRAEALTDLFAKVGAIGLRFRHRYGCEQNRRRPRVGVDVLKPDFLFQGVGELPGRTARDVAVACLLHPAGSRRQELNVVSMTFVIVKVMMNLSSDDGGSGDDDDGHRWTDTKLQDFHVAINRYKKEEHHKECCEYFLWMANNRYIFDRGNTTVVTCKNAFHRAAFAVAIALIILTSESATDVMKYITKLRNSVDFRSTQWEKHDDVPIHVPLRALETKLSAISNAKGYPHQLPVTITVASAWACLYNRVEDFQESRRRTEPRRTEPRRTEQAGRRTEPRRTAEEQQEAEATRQSKAAAAFHAMSTGQSESEIVKCVQNITDATDLMDQDGHSLLHRAANAHMVEVVKALLQQPLPPRLNGLTGQRPEKSTALMLACQRPDSKGTKAETVKVPSTFSSFRSSYSSSSGRGSSISISSK